MKNPAFGMLLVSLVIHFLLFLVALTTNDPYMWVVVDIIALPGTWGLLMINSMMKRGARGGINQWDVNQYQRITQMASDVHELRNAQVRSGK